MLDNYAQLSKVTMSRSAFTRRLMALGVDVRKKDDMTSLSRDILVEALEIYVKDMFEVDFVKPVIMPNMSGNDFLKPLFIVYVRLSNDVSKLDVNRLKLTNPSAYEHFSRCFGRV